MQHVFRVLSRLFLNSRLLSLIPANLSLVLKRKPNAKTSLRTSLLRTGTTFVEADVFVDMAYSFLYPSMNYYIHYTQRECTLSSELLLFLILICRLPARRRIS